MGVALVDDTVKYCALPGCNAVIEPVPGRPERRYCSPAHRAAARQARRAAARREREARLAETLPWLRTSEEPTTTGERQAAVEHARSRPGLRSGAASPSTQPPTRAERPRRNLGRISRRRRTLAVLGVAGLIAGGYTGTASGPVPPSPPPVQVNPVPSEEEWAAQARIALTSVERQLDTLVQAEEEWERLAEKQRAAPGSPPKPVREMRERKALLERQRATLQSQLDAYRSLKESESELEVAEQHLRTVERALRDVPPQPRRTPEQASTIAALSEQRDLRIRQRDVKRQEVENLRRSVEAAKLIPLPDTTAATTELANRVREVIRNGGRSQDREDGTTAVPRQPDVVIGRGQDGRSRRPTGTSRPPEPRGTREGQGTARQTGDSPRAKRPGATGVLDSVVGSVGELLGSAPSGRSARNDREPAARERHARAEAGSPRRDTREKPTSRQDPARGVLENVGDTVGGLLATGSAVVSQVTGAQRKTGDDRAGDRREKSGSEKSDARGTKSEPRSTTTDSGKPGDRNETSHTNAGESSARGTRSGPVGAVVGSVGRVLTASTPTGRDEHRGTSTGGDRPDERPSSGRSQQWDDGERSGAAHNLVGAVQRALDVRKDGSRRAGTTHDQPRQDKNHAQARKDKNHAQARTDKNNAHGSAQSTDSGSSGEKPSEQSTGQSASSAHPNGQASLKLTPQQKEAVRKWVTQFAEAAKRLEQARKHLEESKKNQQGRWSQAGKTTSRHEAESTSTASADDGGSSSTRHTWQRNDNHKPIGKAALQRMRAQAGDWQKSGSASTSGDTGASTTTSHQGKTTDSSWTSNNTGKDGSGKDGKAGSGSNGASRSSWTWNAGSKGDSWSGRSDSGSNGSAESTSGSNGAGKGSWTWNGAGQDGGGNTTAHSGSGKWW